jgi:hypothetical protein
MKNVTFYSLFRLFVLGALLIPCSRIQCGEGTTSFALKAYEDREQKRLALRERTGKIMKAGFYGFLSGLFLTLKASFNFTTSTNNIISSNRRLYFAFGPGARALGYTAKWTGVGAVGLGLYKRWRGNKRIDQELQHKLQALQPATQTMPE